MLDSAVALSNRAVELGFFPECFAARTEQHHVGGRSVEAFVHGGNARRDQLDLGPRERGAGEWAMDEP